MISDCDLYLNWVSVVLRMRSFTVRFKTRTHLSSFMHRCCGFRPTSRLHKCVIQLLLINIIYVLLLWVSPKVSVAVYTNMLLFSSKTLSSASSNSHAFDSVEIWYLQTSPLACYWYFGHFHSFIF